MDTKRAGKASILALITVVLTVSTILLFRSFDFTSASYTPTPTPNCGTETYENDGDAHDINNSRVFVHLHHSGTEEVDVTGQNGWNVTDLYLAEHNHSYTHFSGGNRSDFNPSGISDIYKVKVDVTKTCPTATPTATPTRTPTPTPTRTPTATPRCTATPTPTVTPTATPTSVPTATPTDGGNTGCTVDCATPTPTTTPSESPKETATPSSSATPDPTNNSNVSDGGDGLGCAVNDCSGNKSQITGTGTGGQVLGASTMAGTGSFAENIYTAIMVLGGTLSAFGIKNFKKASR